MVAEETHAMLKKPTVEELLKEKWIRLPSKGLEPHTGLTRSYIYMLISAGKVKSASIRRPGCITGVRLVWLPSLMDYIERNVDKEWKRQNLHLGEHI